MSALLLGTLLLLQPGQAGEFVHSPSNLKFQMPTGAVATKKKDVWTITFPVGPSDKKATAQVFAVSFTAAPEVWETAQKYFAEQQKLTLLSQTREELSGIPLFLSRMQSSSAGGSQSIESGLIYGATEFKMSFRLTADELVFGDAEAKWKEMLLSVRPVVGVLPSSETPGRIPEAPATKRRPPKVPENKAVPIGKKGTADMAPVIGVVRIEAALAGKKVQLCVGEGWALEAIEDGKVRASHTGGEVAEVELYSVLESGSMSQALSIYAAAGLRSFDIVTSRSESVEKPNRAGCKVSRIVREGKAGDKTLFHAYFAGIKGDSFWLFRLSSLEPISAVSWQRYAALADSMSIEPTP